MNSKFKIQISIALILFVSVQIFTSCEKEVHQDLSTPEVETNIAVNQDDEKITNFENYHIHNRVLVFEDFESYSIAYHNIEDFLLQLNQNKFRSQDDFKSLKSIYDDIHNEIWEFREDQEDEIYEFIEQNSKYVSLGKSEDSAQELINLTDTRQDKFANQDFVFMIDDVMYDVRDIENLYENSQTISRMDCGQELEVTVTNNNNGCRNDRRGIIRGKSC